MPGEVWTSGEWAGQTRVVDYRSEWIGEKLIERVTFSESAPLASCAFARMGTMVRQPLQDIVRFWLLDGGQIIDKGFDGEAEPVGYFAPVTAGFERDGDTLEATQLYLGLSMDQEGRVTVTGEAEFEQAVARNELSQDEIQLAEERIRELTLAAAAKQWPSPFVRNFAILKEGER